MLERDELTIWSDVFNILSYAAVELKTEAFRAGVLSAEGQARHQECGLPESSLKLRDRERGPRFENLLIWPVSDPGAGYALGDLSNFNKLAFLGEGFERSLGTISGEDARFSPAKRHFVGLAPTINLYIQPGT